MCCGLMRGCGVQGKVIATAKKLTPDQKKQAKRGKGGTGGAPILGDEVATRRRNSEIKYEKPQLQYGLCQRCSCLPLISRCSGVTWGWYTGGESVAGLSWMLREELGVVWWQDEATGSFTKYRAGDKKPKKAKKGKK